jgi:hypothetical protein
MSSNRPQAIKSPARSGSRTFPGMRQQQEGDIDELRPRRPRNPEPRASGIQQGIGGILHEGEELPFWPDLPGLPAPGSPVNNPRMPGSPHGSDFGSPPPTPPRLRQPREDPSGGIGEIGDVPRIPDGRKPNPPNHKNSLKEDIVSGIREALGIGNPAPYYVPNKINRDNGRLGAINRIPQSKTWSIAELEYYNRKGYVNYNVKNVQNRRLPNVFAPKLPDLAIERRPATTSYNKPGMYASIDRTHQPSQIPTSFLVA